MQFTYHIGLVLMSKNKELREFPVEKFSGLIDRRQYAKARQLLTTFSESTTHYIAGAWIDLGHYSCKETDVKKGIDMCNKALFGDTKVQDSKKMWYYYNLGNAYYSLFGKKISLEGYKPFKHSRFLLKATRYFRSSKDLGNHDPQLYINYLNSLSSQGRYLEAIEQCANVIKMYPEFGMAYGNMAEYILRFADICGTYRVAQYVYAYQFLKKAVRYKDSIIQYSGREALERFRNSKLSIEKMFKDHPEVLHKNLSHRKPSYRDNTDPVLQEFYNFSIKNDLFLNLHVQNKNSDPALDDPVFIQPITPLDGSETFYRLAHWINEIKESYMTARYLLFEAGRKTRTKTCISKLTTLVNTLDYSSKNIYLGLRKAAFKEAYGILDRIAGFLDEYLDIAAPNKNGISWNNIWFKGQKEPRVNSPSSYFGGQNQFHDKIMNEDNYLLFGLFSLYLDTSNQGLRDLRNTLVHRKLQVKVENISTDKDTTLTSKEFEDKSLEMLKLTRCAIIYLINFVNTSEKSKYEPNKVIMPLHVDTRQII